MSKVPTKKSSDLANKMPIEVYNETISDMQNKIEDLEVKLENEVRKYNQECDKHQQTMTKKIEYKTKYKGCNKNQTSVKGDSKELIEKLTMKYIDMKS